MYQIKRCLYPCLLLLVWLSCLIPTAYSDEYSNEQSEEQNVKLIDIMGNMQRFTHKLYLAHLANNLPLVDFYTHELEENIIAIDAVSSYAGYPVASMARSILRPSFQQLENAVKAKYTAKVAQTLSDFIDSCNNCHNMTERNYIVIELNKSNPYLQNFSGHALKK